MDKKNEQKIMRDFSARKLAQIIAISVTLALFVMIAFGMNHGLFGDMFSGATLASVQILLALAFINFTVFNWRCPSCKKFLGSGIVQDLCRNCGAKFKE